MDRELAREWARLMDQALAMVRRGEPGLSGYQRLLQIAVLPSFGVAASWELFAPTFAGRGREHTVAMVAWDARADSAKFESPIARQGHPARVDPTIRRTRASIPPDRIESLVGGFAHLALPVVPANRPFGADGASYRFAAGDFFARSVFEWWGDGPPSWAPLVAEFRRVHAELESIVPISASE